MRVWGFRGQEEGSKLKAPKTSGGGKTPVRHTIPLGIVIFVVVLVVVTSNLVGPKAVAPFAPRLIQNGLSSVTALYGGRG